MYRRIDMWDEPCRAARGLETVLPARVLADWAVWQLRQEEAKRETEQLERLYWLEDLRGWKDSPKN
jgi:hypothetical protein